jgi:hypothetical protein
MYYLIARVGRKEDKKRIFLATKISSSNLLSFLNKKIGRKFQ